MKLNTINWESYICIIQRNIWNFFKQAPWIIELCLLVWHLNIRWTIWHRIYFRDYSGIYFSIWLFSLPMCFRQHVEPVTTYYHLIVLFLDHVNSSTQLHIMVVACWRWSTFRAWCTKVSKIINKHFICVLYSSIASILWKQFLPTSDLMQWKDNRTHLLEPNID